MLREHPAREHVTQITSDHSTVTHDNRGHTGAREPLLWLSGPEIWLLGSTGWGKIYETRGRRQRRDRSQGWPPHA